MAKEYFKAHINKPPKQNTVGRKKGYKVKPKPNPVGRLPKWKADEKLKQEKQEVLDLLSNFWKF